MNALSEEVKSDPQCTDASVRQTSSALQRKALEHDTGVCAFESNSASYSDSVLKTPSWADQVEEEEGSCNPDGEQQLRNDKMHNDPHRQPAIDKDEEQDSDSVPCSPRRSPGRSSSPQTNNKTRSNSDIVGNNKRKQHSRSKRSRRASSGSPAGEQSRNKSAKDSQKREKDEQAGSRDRRAVPKSSNDSSRHSRRHRSASPPASSGNSSDDGPPASPPNTRNRSSPSLTVGNPSANTPPRHQRGNWRRNSGGFSPPSRGPGCRVSDLGVRRGGSRRDGRDRHSIDLVDQLRERIREQSKMLEERDKQLQEQQMVMHQQCTVIKSACDFMQRLQIGPPPGVGRNLPIDGRMPPSHPHGTGFPSMEMFPPLVPPNHLPPPPGFFSPPAAMMPSHNTGFHPEAGSSSRPSPTNGSFR